MIARLNCDDIISTGEPTTLFVVSGGITYEVEVHPRIHESQNLSELSRLGIWIWQVFAEDKHTMYGFMRREERALAMRIREVQGMGPVSSAKLVQTAGADEVLRRIIVGDTKSLSALCSGLGLKRAQSIINEMAEYARLHSPGTLAPPEHFRVSKLVSVATQLGIAVDPVKMAQTVRKFPEFDDSTIFAEYMKLI